MHMTFTWGEQKDPYLVLDYNISLNTLVSDTQIADCLPSELCLTIEFPATVNPAAELIKFARTQHNEAKGKGPGTLSVFKGKGVGQSIQDITFMDCWITGLDMGVTQSDKTFLVHVRFAAAIITISGETFEHGARAASFVE